MVACSQNYSEKKVDETLREKDLEPMIVAAENAGGTASADLAGEGRQSLGGLSAVVPSGWRQVPPANSMRLAEYHLSGAEAGADDGVLAIFQLGGSVEDNIKRWYGQFSGPDGRSAEEGARRREKQVDGMTATLVDVSGMYAGMGPMGSASDPKEDYRMLAAIVEAPRGLYFFKLVGPAATLAQWAESFDQFVDSLAKE